MGAKRSQRRRFPLRSTVLRPKLWLLGDEPRRGRGPLGIVWHTHVDAGER